MVNGPDFGDAFNRVHTQRLQAAERATIRRENDADQWWNLQDLDMARRAAPPSNEALRRRGMATERQAELDRLRGISKFAIGKLVGATGRMDTIICADDRRVRKDTKLSQGIANLVRNPDYERNILIPHTEIARGWVVKDGEGKTDKLTKFGALLLQPNASLVHVRSYGDDTLKTKDDVVTRHTPKGNITPVSFGDQERIYSDAQQQTYLGEVQAMQDNIARMLIDRGLVD